LAIELSLRCQMCDLHSKFEEYRTKSAVAIVRRQVFRTEMTVIIISVQCHALHWTDKNMLRSSSLYTVITVDTTNLRGCCQK